MRIGVPKEIKNHEYRVGLVPAAVLELVKRGHEVFIEHNAGSGINLFDSDYEQAGATILDNADAIFDRADMIVKVKEPQSGERQMLRRDQILFTYLHLAPDPEQTRDLVNSGASCIAYETVTDARGRLPLLAPMSEVAGRLSIQAGAHCLEKSAGGSGVLLGGVPGVPPAKVVVIGGGVVGYNATRMAVGLGARVVVLDRTLDVLRHLDELFGSQVETVHSNAESIQVHTANADLVIGGVLIPGAAAPKLVTREHLRQMNPGSVVVDVAIDQGGCFETSHPTTHDSPTFVEEQVVHYCVANMPGAVARTSTFALNHATLPFTLRLADHGLKAMYADEHLRRGLNVYRGQVTCAEVAHDLGYDFVSPESVLGI
jgi:alanine dehydrogenase